MYTLYFAHIHTFHAKRVRTLHPLLLTNILVRASFRIPTCKCAYIICMCMNNIYSFAFTGKFVPLLRTRVYRTRAREWKKGGRSVRLAAAKLGFGVYPALLPSRYSSNSPKQVTSRAAPHARYSHPPPLSSCAAPGAFRLFIPAVAVLPVIRPAKSRRVTRSSCSSSEARAALIIRPGKRGRMAVIRSRCRSRGRWVCAPAPVA